MSIRYFDRWSILILLAGFALSLYHFATTDWYNYNNDAFEHRAYIEYIAEHHRIPPPYERAAFRHPPTYYALAAIPYAAFGVEGARLLSMLFYGVFIVYCALAIRLMVPRGAGYYAALALVSFWPLGMTLGARLTSDPMLTACMAATLYHLLRWQKQFDHAQLAAALGFVAAGLLLKNNMLMWVGLIAVPVVYGLCRKHFSIASLMRRDVLLACAVVIFAASSTFARASLFHYGVARRDNFQGYLPVNRLDTVYFDLLTFITESIYQSINVFVTAPFFNVFLRSLLFDQFMWQSEWFTLLVAVMFLTLLMYSAVGLPWMLWQRATVRRAVVLLAWIVAGLTGVLIFVFLYYHTQHYANARYVYVIVPIFAGLHGMVMDWHKDSGRVVLARMGGVLAVLFVVSSILLLFAQHVRALRLDIAN